MQPVPIDAAPLVIAAGVTARMAVAVGLGTLPAFPGVSPRARLAAVAALVLVALPMALQTAAPAEGPWPLAIAGEAVIGLLLGMCVAAVVAAAGWAGSLLGSVSGLSWADDFDPGSGAEAAGISRLAWWLGVAAFLSAGGQLAVVAGLLDSLRVLPVGSLLAADRLPEHFVLQAATIATVAVSLAVTLALPALAAVIAFHLASAICLRAVPFSPGSGLLQGLAALVLLTAFGLGLEAWTGACSTLMHAAVERIFVFK